MAELLADEPTLEFQSTHPVRGATGGVVELLERNRISIHAPREGCDSTPTCSRPASCNFNPRTP